ncbi:MAG: hypothetical protein P8J87_04735 [Verrucomicrobiales bacterium]|nr:hypothetical protein [Verrucomicrobiales bacterium]
MPQSPHIPKLLAKLARLRASIVVAEIARRLALTLGLVLLALIAIAFVDHSAEFSLNARRTLLFTTGSIATTGILWALVALVTARQNNESLALLVEKTDPALSSRLIATLQFASGKGAVPSAESKVFIDALTDETATALADRSAIPATETRSLSTALKITWAILLLSAVTYLLTYPTSGVLLSRAFLSDIPVPRETAITASPGDLTVGIGDSITLSFAADGTLPSSGQLDLTFPTSQSTASLTPSKKSYSATIDSVPGSFTYTATINDAVSEPAKITALPRPEITGFTAHQTYPDFTQIAPTDHLPGDLQFFPGAKVELQITSSKPLASATIELLGVQQQPPTATTGQAAGSRFTIPADGLTGIKVTLTDTDGLGLRDTPVYRCSVIDDLPPTIRILEPVRLETLATRQAKIPVRFEANDRFGIAALSLHYLHNQQPGSQPVQVEPLGKSIDHSFEFDLASLGNSLKEGDTVEFWIEAADPNPTVAAGVSRHHIARIVSSADKRAELLGRVADSLGRIGDVALGQETLNAALGKILRSSTKSARANEEPETGTSQ